MSAEACCKLAETLGPERLAALDAELRSPTSRGVKRIARDLGTNHMAVHRHRTGCLKLGAGQTEEAPVTPRTAQTAPAPKSPLAVDGSSPVEKPTPAPEPAATSHAPSVPERVTSGGTAREQGGNSEGNTATVTPEVEGNSLATQATNTARALPASGARSNYARAVEAAVALISSAQWRSHHVEGLAGKFGLSRGTARNAYSEAVRHLHLDMGGYLEKLGVSAAYVTKERDGAKVESARAKDHAERWRRQEREAQEAADRLTGKERIAMLETAARFGLLATKYDLSAEKWSAQALAHQRHLDEVLCLRSPKEVHMTQNNFGAGGADLTSFAAVLARRFADRPDVQEEIAAVAAELERGGGEPLLVESEAV